MKPIAWIHPSDLEKLPHEDCWVNGQPSKGDIPLYTEPQYKELSDEEITEILIEKEIWGRLKDGTICCWQDDADLIDFARAILKKASE